MSGAVLINGRTVSPAVTLEAVVEMCHRRNRTLDNPGACIACGEEAHGVEPDARAYECESCGEAAVYGCEELLMELM